MTIPASTQKALSIIGSSRANGDRPNDDFYPTPEYAVRELLKRESFQGLIWEPACGDGAISRVLVQNGIDTYSSDISPRSYGDKIDFLDYQGDSFDGIITNPPYKYALDFVLQSKKFCRCKIAMFLKTVFLESESRYAMFQDKQFPLRTMYQFSKRVTLRKEGLKTKNSGMISYAWFVWDREYSGKPTLEWIP